MLGREIQPGKGTDQSGETERPSRSSAQGSWEAGRHGHTLGPRSVQEQISSHLASMARREYRSPVNPPDTREADLGAAISSSDAARLQDFRDFLKRTQPRHFEEFREEQRRSREYIANLQTSSSQSADHFSAPQPEAQILYASSHDTSKRHAPQEVHAVASTSTHIDARDPITEGKERADLPGLPAPEVTEPSHPKYKVDEVQLIAEFRNHKLDIEYIRESIDSRIAKSEGETKRVYEDLRKACNEFLLSQNLVGRPSALTRLEQLYPDVDKTKPAEYVYQLISAIKEKESKVAASVKGNQFNRSINTLLDIYESCKQPQVGSGSISEDGPVQIAAMKELVILHYHPRV